MRKEIEKNYLVITSILICAFWLTDCSRNGSDERSEKNDFLEIHLEDFKKRYPLLNSNDWVLQKAQKTDDEISMKLYRDLNDTWINIDLSIEMSQTDTSFEIKRYINHFKDSSHNYYVHLENGRDTLYFYKSLKSNSDPRNYHFIRGKYRYMFDNVQLTSSQAAFFKLKQDSLTKVVGNDLPPLPFK